MPSFKISEAGERDIPTLATHRVEMFQELFPKLSRLDLRRIRSETTRSLGTMMSHCQGVCWGWLAQDSEGRDVGSTLLLLHRCLPCPEAIFGLDAVVSQIYVRPPHRRLGLATRLLEAAVGDAQGRGFRQPTAFWTEASARLWVKLGFTKRDARMRIAESNLGANPES